MSADEHEIAKWAKQANAQYSVERNFVNIFPWKEECQGPYIHFVAHTIRNGEPLVCGWLTLIVEENGDFGYIDGISTRQIKDEFRTGVGQLLNNAAVEWATAKGLKFLYLWPLNDKIRAIYTTPGWGYVSVDKNLPHLFRSLSEPPSKNLLEKWIFKRRTQHQNALKELLEFTDQLANNGRTGGRRKTRRRRRTGFLFKV